MPTKVSAMADSNLDKEISIQFPDACPWGMAVYSESGGNMLKANRHMLTYYFDSNLDAKSLDDQFRCRSKGGWPTVFEQLQKGLSWTGRVVPLANQHGISSVEVMIYADREVDGRLWLYTLEHPSVNGGLRFSSRSEIKLLQALLDNTLEYVFLRDTEGRFILTNRAFRQAASIPIHTSPSGELLSDYISEECAKWVDLIDDFVIGEGKPSVNKVTHFAFKNGKKHWLQMTTVPVRNSDGFLIGSVSVASDISELKRTESNLRFAIDEAKAASRAKGEFLAAMSHEIRTPINGIIGATELCLETGLDAEQQDYLETVVQCSDTLLCLINDVLDFSKIEAGQLSLETLNFCPINLIEDVAAEFSQQARKKKLELIVSYEEGVPKYVMGDPTRVKQILYNLVSNGIKFTHKGDVVLRAEVVEQNEVEVCIRFLVTDSGIGIDTSYYNSIFNSFTQADMSTTRQYGGTGLGLSICKELTELMGGQIDVKSDVGKGSTFYVEIPFELTPSRGADTIPFNPELAGLRVLIVDDNATNRDIYAQMCAGWGYRSALASNGQDALSMLESSIRDRDLYQLILLDYHMPGLSGIDLASLIRNRSELDDCRIILLSSALNRAEVEQASKFGISRALTKPVRRATLLEVIMETFDVKHKVSGEGVDAPPACADVMEARSLNILLAEDNEVNQKIASHRLKKMGHSVTVASNGADVLRLNETQTFDCILMDIQMPNMDGYQTTRRIRSKEKESGLPAMYIIAMTANVMKGDRECCIECGMDDYISKPFRAEDLQGVLAKVRVSVENRGVGSESLERVPFLERLKTLDPEDQVDVLAVAAIFSRTLPDELNRFELALKSRDCQQVRFVAHSLKGVSSIFLRDPCVAVAQKIEDACCRNSIEDVDAHAEEMIIELGVLAEEIKAAL
ncbi:MAG TPA: hypothetical protein DCX06_11705 [Opitutae bacterium]|nr:hypothetical protein [Opitutae bacterium]